MTLTSQVANQIRQTKKNMKTLRFVSSIAVFLLSIIITSAQTVVFSNDKGGFQDKDFDLTLSASEGTYSIRYTLDGTIPTTKSTLYTSPIHISKTTPVSVSLFDDGGNEVNRSVRTYIFLKDVYQQPNNPAGYPSTWTTGYKAYYTMSTEVTQGEDYKDLMDDAMKAIPTVCIVTTIDNLFDSKTGIYSNPEQKGDSTEWERPASVEYYEKDGFIQQNCGIRIHGGNSRKPGNSAKHSFRLYFKDTYGPKNLKYQIFEDKDATKKFKRLVLRAGYNYTWIKNGSKTLYPQNIIQRTNAQYITDSWAKEAAHSMGHLITHRRFVHLFINGLYWGMYEICERIDDKFASEYLGGEDEDYDIIEDPHDVSEGDITAYNTMYQAACKVGSSQTDANYAKLIDQQLLDMQNYADYMLLQWYLGNDDWDKNNWEAIRSRVEPGNGFVYMVWDAETCMTDVNINKVTMKSGDPTTMMASLKKNPKFKAIMQERIRTHFTGDGILTPTKAAELYEKICSEIDLPIICESARWGGYRKFTGEAEEIYTRNDHWLIRKDDLLKNYFPKRTDIVLKQLKDAGLFDPTGIEEIYNGQQPTVNGQQSTAVYNLQGQRVNVNSNYRGFAIIGNKKILVK